MCEVEFLGGVVFWKVRSTIFYVGRVTTTHYQIVDLKDIV